MSVGRKKQTQKRQPPKGFTTWVPVSWTRKCIVCGQVPTMPETEMCGACTCGDASVHLDLIEEGGYWK
jgi:hypothetical protein